MDKVWIELDSKGGDAACIARAKKLSKMLERLGSRPDSIVYRYDIGRYCRLSVDQSFSELDDNGDWFNLDYFAGGIDG